MKTMCTNCMGKGYIAHYDHIADGICFKCKGSGEVKARETKSRSKKTNVKVYDKESEYKKYIDKKHSEALEMNKEYDRRKTMQNVNTRSMEEDLNDFFAEIGVI